MDYFLYCFKYSHGKLFAFASKIKKRVVTVVIAIVGRAKAIRKRSKELIPNIMQRRVRAVTILEQYRKVVMQKLYKN